MAFPRVVRMLMLAMGLGGALLGQVAPPRLFTYKTVGGVALQAHIFEPSSSTEPRPAILLFHGGGWNMGDATWVYPSARRFAALGFVAVAVEYRLSDERQVTPLEAMADARDAFRWVRSQATPLRISPRKVVGYGVSAGGHLVVAAALVTPKGVQPDASAVPDAMVLYSPAVAISRSEWVRKLLLDHAQPSEISPDQHVRPGLPPTLITQGQEDGVTPFAGAVLFTRAMKAAGNTCELQRHSGLGHLLTRNLEEQEWGFDPDPVAREAAYREEEAFLSRQGFLPPRPVTPPSPESVVRGYCEALSLGQVARALQWVAPESAWFLEGSAPSPPATPGPEGLRTRLEQELKARPGAKVELHMLTTNGAFVSVRERVSWAPPDAPPRSRNALVVYEVAEGRIRRVWRYPEQ
ncbi:MAG TPA: alpha/beta hydrolase fold domain-containing protein [Holophagaceae bacterium]|nr:alpha/beta hydrolase fold domain-containing protein [Holophagaceae bacterium]